MACQSVLTDEILEQVLTIVRQTLNVTAHASTREIEIDRLNRDLKQAEKRVQNLTDAVADADSKDVRASLFAALRDEQKRMADLRASLDEAKASPLPLDPKTVLKHMEGRIRDLRARLAVGGIDALPAVLAILGEERFTATRTADGWVLKARVSSGFLFDKDDRNQRASITGDVTGVTITPVTRPTASASATSTTSVATAGQPSAGTPASATSTSSTPATSVSSVAAAGRPTVGTAAGAGASGSTTHA
jgi:hypothetical protein